MKKLYFLILIALSSHSLFAQTIRYVKSAAEGSGDGSTWANASSNLQAMINASAAGDQVWVAAGTYKPTEKLQEVVYQSGGGGAPTTDRDKAFIMKGAVKLYGGFIGIESLLSERNYTANITILSGDLNNDNIASDGDCYHVVSCRNDANGAVLDGFTIKNGYANGTANVSGNGTDGLSSTTIPQNVGGGIAVRGNTTAIVYSNLILEDNYAADAGGAASFYISGVGTIFPLEKVTVRNNTSVNEGGGLRVYIVSGTPVINMTSMHFQNNSSSTTTAGALYIYVNGGTPVVNIAESKFISNSAATRGGGVYALGYSASAYPTVNIANSLFYNNLSASSTLGGGAISLSTGTKCYVVNSTFYNNRATNAAGAGGAIHVGSSASCQLYLYNSIMNGNIAGSGTSNDIFKGSVAPAPIIKNSLTQAYGTNGVDGNIVNSSPLSLFASTNSIDADFLKLAVASIALDKGENSLSTALVDLANLPRIRNVTIDLGAYEFQTGNYPLPVKLESYTAVKQGATAVLTWKTASEKNNQKFVIERGSSADSFAFFKDVAGAGDSNTPLSYSVTDFAPIAGTNYYRLTQYDNDGKSEILGVQAVSFELTSAKTKVYPNPAKSYIEVKPSSSNAIISLNLISLTGKTILTNNYAQGANENVKLDLTNIPTGTYVLWVNKGKSNSEKQTLLVVK